MADKKQRKINRWVRAYNKILAKDSFLGLNRFYLKQVYRVGNDYDTIYVLQVYDRVTNESSQDIAVSLFDYERKLFWACNDFIVEVRKVEKW